MGSTLKTSRLAPPELWVARVGGSVRMGCLVARKSGCMYFRAIVLDS